MKRRRLQFLIFCLALIISGYLIYKVIHKIQLSEEVSERLESIPQFTFQTRVHHNFSKQNIEDTLGRVIFYLFSPDCEHCQYMAKSIVENKERIGNIEFVMVTPFVDSVNLERFIDSFHLNTMPNVQILLDDKMQFDRTFGVALVPSFFVYKDNKLVKKVTGETKIENLIND